MKIQELDSEYLDENGVNKVYGFSVSRLRADRHYQRGLPYIKVGRSVLYNRKDVRLYLESRKIKHEQ